jgi:hypothetical protein
MPAEAPDIEDSVLSTWASAIDDLELPLNDDEAIALLSWFPADDDTVFGLAWSLLHAIETAPYGVSFICALDDRSWWVAFFKQRAIRGGIDVTGAQLPLGSGSVGVPLNTGGVS